MADIKNLHSRPPLRGKTVLQHIGDATALQGITWSIPNQITIVRILLTPLFIILLSYDLKIPALVIFCLLGLSDGLDGLIARRYQQSTPLGALLDPLADKVLLVASFLMLSSLGVFPVWLTILVVSRDAMIVAGAVYLKLFEEKPAIPPSMLGKLTTGIQLVAIFWVLLFHFLNSRPPFLDGISIVTAVITFVSGSQYLLGFMRRVGDSS